MYKKPNDRLIQEAIIGGKISPEIMRQLVDLYKEPLYWHIRKLVVSHDDTHDILQEVFIKAWKGLATFRGESKLYTWLFRIATNESLNFLAEKSRRVYGNSEAISALLEERLTADTYFDGNAIELELQRALLKLTDRQRLIFNMKYFDDMPYDQMAEILEVAVGTLKATYHTAVTRIKEQMNLTEL